MGKDLSRTRTGFTGGWVGTGWQRLGRQKYKRTPDGISACQHALSPCLWRVCEHRMEQRLARHGRQKKNKTAGPWRAGILEAGLPFDPPRMPRTEGLLENQDPSCWFCPPSPRPHAPPAPPLRQ
eukprot:gene15959-biopygen20231